MSGDPDTEPSTEISILQRIAHSRSKVLQGAHAAWTLPTLDPHPSTLIHSCSRFCKEHMLPGQVDVRNKECRVFGCPKRGVKTPPDREGRVCHRHLKVHQAMWDEVLKTSNIKSQTAIDNECALFVADFLRNKCSYPIKALHTWKALCLGHSGRRQKRAPASKQNPKTL